MPEGGEGPHSDRISGVTYDSELDSPNCTTLLMMCVSQSIHFNWTALLQHKISMLHNELILRHLWLLRGAMLRGAMFAGTLMDMKVSNSVTDCQFVININCSSLLTCNYQYY